MTGAAKGEGGRTLFIHMGQPKTGTTWLQAALRLSRDALAAQGVAYPPAPGGEPDDPAAITSGNGKGLLDGPQALAARLAEAKDARAALFSSERLQDALLDLPDPSFIAHEAARAGFARIEALLFIRDPVEHAASLGQQRVKRHGATEGPDALIARFDQPARAAEAIARIAALDGTAGVRARLTVRNYSVCRRALLPELAAWLGAPPELLRAPPLARANRALTRSELALQLRLNRALADAPDAAARIGADAFCQRVPDIPAGQSADPFRASPEAERRMLARLAPAMARVDAFVAPEHRYRPERARPPAPSPEAAAGHMFDDAQLDALAGGVADEVLRLRAELARLRAAPEQGLGARLLARALLRRLGMLARGRAR
ncbi:hypothetical protein [Oceanicella actignis]|uniref:hypothetical protein n=1 Tax=Oceanicella actignis TaxID=1189325 RepID=UPI0012539AC1|nr:hypothetical protein [Oceanicella actignis]TYO89210.1 hypothetical protein LY05_01826 [Oceanicella actignis]